MAARNRKGLAPTRRADPPRPRGRRGEGARRSLAEGLERSHRVVERYRALLVRLHDPAGTPAPRLRLKPGAGSSG